MVGEEPQWWEILAAVAAAVGGVSAAVTALFAWRSARASERTSLESRRALGAALRPSPYVRIDDLAFDEIYGGRKGLHAIVFNVSNWDAADVEVEIFYRDGRQAQDSTERVPSHDGQRFTVPLELKDPQGKAFVEVERLTLRYSDSQRIARYERRYKYFHAPNLDPGWWEESEEQIAGP